MRITTVLGEIDSACLGFFHSHEHLFIKDGKSAQIDKALLLDDYGKIISELIEFKNNGGEGLIDCQPIGCGRMADKLALASKETSINIIGVTGFHKTIFYDDSHWIITASEDEITKLFLTEITNGMYVDGENSFPTQQGSSKAGAIKTAADKGGITGTYEKLFECAANASLETGAPIICHTEMGEKASNLAEFFLSKKIPARSAVICHTDRIIKELSYYKELFDMGVYLEFDTIGRQKYHSDEDEAELISKLTELGYEDNILLGLDVTNKRIKSYCGQIGLTYIIKTFIPLLIKYGLKTVHIDKFMKQNPSIAFSNYRRID